MKLFNRVPMKEEFVIIRPLYWHWHLPFMFLCSVSYSLKRQSVFVLILFSELRTLES